MKSRRSESSLEHFLLDAFVVLLLIIGSPVILIADTFRWWHKTQKKRPSHNGRSALVSPELNRSNRVDKERQKQRS